MKLERREFLQRSIMGLLGSTGAGSVLTGLSLSNAIAQESTDYRSLVCIFLYGGNDSFNMFVPSDSVQYDTYQDARRNLAVAKNQLLQVGPQGSDGSRYGFHPSMNSARDLFSQGQLAVVGNVGPLIVPTTRDDYQQKRVPLPPQLFSHNDQQLFWQTLKGGSVQPSGWAGRMADAMATANQNRQLSMNISMSGINMMQTGRTSVPGRFEMFLTKFADVPDKT